MTTLTLELSATATALLNFLKANGCQWKQNCIKGIFGNPEYPINGTKQQYIDYWQFDVNIYGNEATYCVMGEWMKFEKNIPVDYASQISVAYQELKTAGLADEKNNGYNEYAFYAK